MKDLTKGNPFKLILFFALPVFLGCVLQQLYNMVDFIIVGNTVGAAAFTGVGLTGPLTFLILGFVNGLTAGFAVKVSQRFGAGDEAGMRHAIGLSFVLCILITAILTAIAAPLTGTMLTLMQTPEQYFDYAESYLFIIFCGMGATVFYNITAGILRAIGDSKSPLFFLIVSVVVNVGLDFAFIVGLKMHRTGAALATVLSQLLSGTLCLSYMLLRYPQLRLKKQDFGWDFRLAGSLVGLGLPMALQYSITAIGCIVQQSAVNGLDASYPGAVTAFAAASKVDNLANQFFPSLGTAIATYAGQNYGAGNMKRVKKGVTAGMVYVAASSVIGFAFCIGLAEPMIKLFLNLEVSTDVDIGAVISYGKTYLLWQSGGYLLLGAVHLFRNALQGVGKSVVTMAAGIMELVGRIVAVFVFVRYFGFIGACAANLTAWLFADIFLVITYFVVLYGHRRHGETRHRHIREHAVAQ